MLSRTLLMAGWVPYRRKRMDEAEAMFREALTVARARANVPTRGRRSGASWRSRA